MTRAVAVATWLAALLLLSNVAAGLTTKSAHRLSARAARRLMDDSSDSSETKGEDDDSSGAENPSKCYEDEDKYDFDIKENMACKDENYIVYRDVSQSVCEEQCACRSDCVAFTYNFKDCFLKQTCYNREWHSYDMSGFKEEKEQSEPTFDPAFCDTNFPAEFEVKNNFACKDPSQKELRDMSEADCQSQCRCSDSCIGYTYNAYRRDCYLKESCNQGEWHPDDKSGMKIEVSYTPWSKTQCQDPVMKRIWYTSNSARSKCQSACTQDSNCGAFTFNTRNWKCELFNTCYNTVWNRDSYTEIKKGYEKPPPIATPSPPPVVNPPKGCNSQGLPFGLDNCICDGGQTGVAVGRQACINVKAQCSFSLQPFSAAQEDLLGAVQRICDTLGVNSCLNNAQETALQDPECFALLSQEGAGRCSTQEARGIFESIAVQECSPICPDCIRLP